jgi:hypothetical protein
MILPLAQSSIAHAAMKIIVLARADQPIHTLHRAWFDSGMQALFPADHRQRPVVLATERQVHPRVPGAALPAGNMDLHGGRLRAQTVLREFVIGQRATQIVEDLLALNPRVVGLASTSGWKPRRWCACSRPCGQTSKVVLGGPEVSFGWSSRKSAAWPTTSSPAGATW